jgi:hypothetical protein
MNSDPGKHFDYSLKYANAYNAQSKYKQVKDLNYINYI